ncbi:hypothetical protein ACIBSW_20950 [Actinoplanes sp. NPDC049668]|uniref:hypothetical protein n=1 Tax=unclassified Actinoplanes TaxID=2626549 RepID=UPI0033A000B5
MARIAAAACVAAGLVASAAAPGHADVVDPGGAPPLRFLSYNICGSGGSSAWRCTTEMTDATRGEVPQRVANVVQNITDWSADAVFLNEVCRNQYDAADDELTPRGYVGVFVTTMSADRCKDPRNAQSSPEEGVALFARGLRALPGGASTGWTGPARPGNSISCCAATPSRRAGSRGSARRTGPRRPTVTTPSISTRANGSRRSWIRGWTPASRWWSAGTSTGRPSARF